MHGADRAQRRRDDRHVRSALGKLLALVEEEQERDQSPARKEYFEQQIGPELLDQGDPRGGSQLLS